MSGRNARISGRIDVNIGELRALSEQLETYERRLENVVDDLHSIMGGIDSRILTRNSNDISERRRRIKMEIGRMADECRRMRNFIDESADGLARTEAEIKDRIMTMPSHLLEPQPWYIRAINMIPIVGTILTGLDYLIVSEYTGASWGERALNVLAISIVGTVTPPGAAGIGVSVARYTYKIQDFVRGEVGGDARTGSSIFEFR